MYLLCGALPKQVKELISLIITVYFITSYLDVNVGIIKQIQEQNLKGVA